MTKEKVKTGLMVYVMIAVAVGMVYLLVFSPGAIQAQEEREQNEEFIRSIIDEGFAPISTQDGLSWDCNKSYYNGSQIITAEGEYLLFVCDSDLVAYFRLCENGVEKSSLGEDDICK